MEFIIKFAIIQKWTDNEVAELNQIRVYKKILIPGELVGMTGCQTTPCFLDTN